jgi:hypothetical protein
VPDRASQKRPKDVRSNVCRQGIKNRRGLAAKAWQPSYPVIYCVIMQLGRDSPRTGLRPHSSHDRPLLLELQQTNGLAERSALQSLLPSAFPPSELATCHVFNTRCEKDCRARRLQRMPYNPLLK